MLRVFLVGSATILCAHSQVRELAEQARRFPPEFAASALVRLAGLRAEPPSWRRAQVEEAFSLAGSAHSPFKKSGQVTYGAPRSLEAYASELNLDAVSLQSRAARAMLEFDTKRARELFQSIVLPRTGETGCSSLAPDYAAYYETASEILARGFTAEERKRGEPFQFATAMIRSMDSAAQAGPVAKVVAGAPLDDGEFDATAAVLGEMLAKLKADDVPFSAAIWRDDLWNQVSTIAARLELRQVATRDLAQAFRSFLVTQATGVRCATAAGTPKPVTDLMKSFNTRFEGSAPPLKPEDLAPSEVKEHTPESTDAAASALAFRLRQLRYADRREPQWRDSAESAAREIADFQPEGLTAAETFHRRAGLFEALLELMSQDGKRDSILEIYTGMVAGSSVRRSDPAGWYWHAQVLTSRLRMAGAKRLLADFETSGDGLLAYQTRVDRIAPEPRPACSETGVCPSLTGPDAMRAELLANLLN